MSETESKIPSLSKLPIANYDIVVYFGVGISFLPFANRYILSTNQKFPAIFDGYSDPLVNTTVSLIALAFGVYIIGHGIALLSSIFIEQFAYRAFGTPSDVLVHAATPSSSPRAFRDYLKARFKSHLLPTNMADIVRLAFHSPILLIYVVMYVTGFYGFYETKLQALVTLRVQTRLDGLFGLTRSILEDNRWFKVIEYACANDHPIATAKMYNYMVIYGLFRSTSFLLLCAIWAEFWFYISNDGLGFVDQTGHGNMLLRVLVLYTSYLISFVGFCKFSRRYTEEAVQAFALSKVFAVDALDGSITHAQ